MENTSAAPVEVGKTYKVKIGAVNPRGEGIAKYENFTIFVGGAKAGTEAKVKISEIKRTYAIAKLQ